MQNEMRRFERVIKALKKLEGFKSGDVAGKVTVPFLLMHGGGLAGRPVQEIILGLLAGERP